MKATYPGFKKCMELMRKHAAQTQEEGFHGLLPHAHEHVPELIAEFQQENDPGLRCWLLELLGTAKSAQAFPVLADSLRDPDEGIRSRAIRGLHALGTKEARQLLWEARSFKLGTEAETESFLRELTEVRSG